MLKFIFWLGLGYLAYRYFIRPKAMLSGRGEPRRFFSSRSNKSANYESEYTDYEIIDKKNNP